MHITEKRIEIRAPVERVFDFFSDFESFPRWMKNIKDVHYTGRRFTRWAAEAPLGTEVEWEAETTHFEPDKRIAWRSVRGDVETEGEVIFEETRRGTTLMRVVLGYALPAGRLGEMVARLFGKDPERQLEDDLERFAAVVEGRRRGSRRDRDEGEREMDERRRREAYARMSEPRRRRRQAASEDVRQSRFDERRAFAERDRRERDYYAAGGNQRDYEEEDSRRERGARGGFEDALRAARRSQLEGQRRYASERARRERERAGDERYAGEYERRSRHFEDERYLNDGRRRAIADERDERRHREDESDERDERREADARYDEEAGRDSRRRYALTPREREMERERNDPDYGYSEQAFRRGVDKLMEEPPSRRWRRWE